MIHPLYYDEMEGLDEVPEELYEKITGYKPITHKVWIPVVSPEMRKSNFYELYQKQSVKDHRWEVW